MAILCRTIEITGDIVIKYELEWTGNTAWYDAIRYSSCLPPGKATSRVAFAFMLLDDIFLAGVEKNPTHLLPWPELK